MGTPRDTVYSRGKGAHKQKSEHCRLRKCDFKSEVCDAFSPLNGRAKNPRLFGGFRIFKNKKTGRIFEISGTYSNIFGNIVKK